MELNIQFPFSAGLEEYN